VLIRHSALYTLGKLLPGLLGMVATGLLTRLLDPAAYGLYGVALVVTTFGSTLVFDWLGLAYLRIAQRTHEAAIAGTVATIFAALVLLIAVVALAAWGAGLLDDPTGLAAAAGLLLMCCYAAFELASRLPVARGQPGRYLMMNAGRGVLSLAGATGAAWLTRDPAWTVCGTALGSVGGVLLGGQRPGWPRFSPMLARQIAVFGLPLACSMALASVANSGVRGLLEALDSTEALGLYTAAFLLVQNTLAVVAAGIASAGYSVAVRLLETGNEAASRRQVAANWSLLLVVMAPMAAGMALTAPQIAAILVGPRYVAGVSLLTPWLAGAGFFAGLRAHGLDHPFQLANRPGQLALVTAVAAAVAVLLTLGLVPRWGPVGAAAASLAAAVCSCALAFVLGQRTWRVPVPIGTGLRVTVACVVMALAVRAVPDSFVIRVGAGVASYASACFALDVLGLRRRVLGRVWPRTVELARD
jgi:O-antigen/teichoic acid export membrane protein